MNNPQPSFSKKEFAMLIDKELNNDTFQEYKKLFKDSYKCQRGDDTYHLKNGLSNEYKETLSYVLKRIENPKQFSSLKDIAKYFRLLLDDKKYIVLFAYNGIGKTRLSVEFKSLGQQYNEEIDAKTADTLYYNAFTEDLFYWDNDLDYDAERKLRLNSNSRFFAGLKDLEMESKIRPLLHRYSDFDFTIDYERSAIRFHRDVLIAGVTERADNIKISRGEENTFIWCFFLAIVQLVVDKDESYEWVKYIYVDDPISSLDDNNVIAVACHLAEQIKSGEAKVIVSTHHALFFNVLCNELKKSEQMFLQKSTIDDSYLLKDTKKTPFFHHVARLVELKKATEAGELYTYHFNILRSIMEKTASFHGYDHFTSCLKKDESYDSNLHGRMLSLMSHGNNSLFDPDEMLEENKQHFASVLNAFIEDYKFNEHVFEEK